MTEANNVETTNISAENTSQTTDSTPWFWDDGKAAEGTKPEWLLDKYGGNVAKQAIAYVELQSKFGGFTGAPEEYDISKFDLEDNATFKEIRSVAKELNMSQEGLEKLVSRLEIAETAESEVNFEQEVAKLGRDGERILKQYKNWTENYLPPEQKEHVAKWIKTADDLKVLTDIIGKGNFVPMPINNLGHSYTNDTRESLYSEIAQNKKRYDSDEAYRKSISARMQALHARGKL